MGMSSPFRGPNKYAVCREVISPSRMSSGIKSPHDPRADSSIQVNITNAALQHPLLEFLPKMLPVKTLSRLRATCSTMKALTDEFPGEIWLAKARLAAPRWVQPKLVYAKDGRAAQALLADQAKKYASTK